MLEQSYLQPICLRRDDSVHRHGIHGTNHLRRDHHRHHRGANHRRHDRHRHDHRRPNDHPRANNRRPNDHPTHHRYDSCWDNSIFQLHVRCHNPRNDHFHVPMGNL